MFCTLFAANRAARTRLREAKEKTLTLSLFSFQRTDTRSHARPEGRFLNLLEPAGRVNPKIGVDHEALSLVGFSEGHHCDLWKIDERPCSENSRLRGKGSVGEGRSEVKGKRCAVVFRLKAADVPIEWWSIHLRRAARSVTRSSEEKACRSDTRSRPLPIDKRQTAILRVVGQCRSFAPYS